MRTSESKIVNKRASDPLDRLIFEDGLRIKDVYVNKELDILMVMLNNKRILRTSVSEFKMLKKASQKQLDNFKCDGIAIHWPSLDEDLSLKGFLKNAVEVSGSMAAEPIVAYEKRKK